MDTRHNGSSIRTRVGPAASQRRPTNQNSHLVEGFGADRFRIRVAQKGEAPAIKLELLAPLTAHTPGTLATVGRGLLIPLDRLTPLIEALDAVRREALEATP